jgi:transposase
MALRPDPIGAIPTETARVAHAAFPKGHPCLRLRDTLGTLYTDEQFAALFPAQGRPAEAPWRLALVTVLQFAEGLSDRQAADAVRDRLAWKYLLGLELTDPGFNFSILSDFRARLVEGEPSTCSWTRCWSAARRSAWSSPAASSARTRRTCWRRCAPSTA